MSLWLGTGQRHRVVAVVDKSLEIAGSGNIPHSSIGPCRVLQVDNPENQHASMIEAVENQSPDVIVVDEITNKRQAEAARTISQRGVSIVATVHGSGLPSIINDPERRELVGGVTSGVLLSDSAARERADKKKAVEKRRCGSPRSSSVGPTPFCAGARQIGQPCSCAHGCASHS